MNDLGTVALGRTGLRVSRLGLGGAPLGGLFTSVAEDDARDTVDAAYASGVRYFDTAPFYGHGTGELRMGNALRPHPRDEFVLSTKVGRVLVPASEDEVEDHQYRDTLAMNPVFDFSEDAVKRSLESSLERLKLGRVDIALVHDPDDHFQEALDGAFPALVRLREEGVVRAIGAGMNQWEMPLELARRVDVDCFLLAGRYTLLDRSAERELLSECERRDIAVIAGGPYNSGILAGGAHYNYEDAPEEMLSRKRELEAICASHDVPLKAAALQFPLRHPAVACVLAGARTRAEAEENARMMMHPIDPSFWEEVS